MPNTADQLTSQPSLIFWRNCVSEKPKDSQRVLLYVPNSDERDMPPLVFGRYIKALDEWRGDGSNNAEKAVMWAIVETPKMNSTT